MSEMEPHLELLAELITTPATRFHCDYCSRFVRDDEVRHESGTAYHACGVDVHRRSVPMGSKERP